MRTPKTHSWLTVLAAALLPWAAACSDSGPSGPGGGAGSGLTLSVAADFGASGQVVDFATPALFDILVSDASGAELTFTSATLVMREVELELQNDDSCDTHIEGMDDGCEEFETGAMRVDLPMDSTVTPVASIDNVPPGTYDEVEFKLHKANDSDDAAFIAANPELDGKSVLVTGSYDPDGSAGPTAPVDFTFWTEIEAEQENDLATPIVVTDDPATSTVNLTLAVDVDGWFRDLSGNLIDPATAAPGGENRSLVESNIKASFRTFEDDDHDGEDDHAEGGS